MKRKVINLNGTWQVAEGSMANAPAAFGALTPVPGAIDLAVPGFRDVAPPLVTKKLDQYCNMFGYRNDRLLDPLREAFWHRREFRIEGAVPSTALLKIHKALYGTRVFLNGQDLGEHLPNFTPGYFDARPALRGNGATNELLVRIGASRDAEPCSAVTGHDHEKMRYIPGIIDDVELILAQAPYIRNVQVAPELPESRIRVRVELEGLETGLPATLHYRVIEKKSGHQVASAAVDESAFESRDGLLHGEFTVSMGTFRTWSPEDPFLYVLLLETAGDSSRTVFGMRSFSFDLPSRRAILNGSTYYLRGTNFCFYRFMEDENRAALPWDPDWVRRLIKACKALHWNSARFSLGSPPDFWYEICDEEGLLIQDEFAVWDPPDRLTAAELTAQYVEWIRERWNHPCVVVWDAQNETPPEFGGDKTAEAIDAVRGLDMQDRPWDNGWSPPRRETDPVEVHLYLLNNDEALSRMEDLRTRRPPPTWWKAQIGRSNGNPLICNEYGWLWIDREGRPGILSKNFKVYERILLKGLKDPTADDYRRIAARTIAQLTEYWRAFGDMAGVQHFSALSYSRLDGHTSDNLIDLQVPEFEPHFKKYVGAAFAPVIAVPDSWEPEGAPGTTLEIDYRLLNDLPDPFEGILTITVCRTEGDAAAKQVSTPFSLPALGREEIQLAIPLPKQEGQWMIVSEISGGSQHARTYRDLIVKASK